MNWITIKFFVTSKFTGGCVDHGSRTVRLIDKRKSPKDHLRETVALLRNAWTPAAFEIKATWAPAE